MDNPIEMVRSYFYCRFILKSHVLPTGLAKGKWHETDERMLYGLFTTFIHFCESEQGCFSNNNKPGREAALSHFEWACELRWDECEVGKGSDKIGQLTGQALAAREQRELYLWWKDVRPNRKDPFTPRGELETPFIFMGESFGKWDMDLEKQYDDEDTEMMVRLVKIRQSLWT